MVQFGLALPSLWTRQLVETRLNILRSSEAASELLFRLRARFSGRVSSCFPVKVSPKPRNGFRFYKI
jgi:hypothetical protein